jgi:hypothetical protein
MKRFIPMGTIALFVACIAFTFTSQLASAHEKRHVGKYTFVVGFISEPAYAQAPNSLDLTICDGPDCNYTVQDGSRIVSNPINDADKTLKIEVSMGTHTPLSLPLEARWKSPGKYNAYFTPALTGAYTFHIFGTANNDKIDERFTSSPTGFSTVGAPVVYPATTNQTNSDVAVLKSQMQNAQNSVNTATTIGIIGAALGVLGMIAAGVALSRKPKVATAESVTMEKSADSLRG